MKKFKVFIAAVLVCCFTAGLSTTSFAAPAALNEDSVPVPALIGQCPHCMSITEAEKSETENLRAIIAQCPQCKNSLYEYQTVWGNVWAFYAERKCIEKPYGTDLGEVLTGTASVRCLQCAYGYTNTYYQYRWTCHGYYQ